MKNIILIYIGIMVSNVVIGQQVPSKFNYQVAIRNSDGTLALDKNRSFRISILESPMAPNSIFSEIHQNIISKYSVASFQIGSGTGQTGIGISSIPFLSKEYFIKVEVDTNNGTNYKPLSTTQLISVPYSLATDKAVYANQAGQLDRNGAISGQVLKWNENKNLWEPGTDEKSTGAGNGTVTSITAGTGLSGGTIITSGTISIAKTGVVSGIYGSSSEVPVITINDQGQITNASKASISGSSGGTVKSIIAGTGLDGGTITNAGTISLKNTGVIPNTYGSSLKIPKFTVNAQGQITSVMEETLNSGGSSPWGVSSDNKIISNNVGDRVVIGNIKTPIDFNNSNAYPGLHVKYSDRFIAIGFQYTGNPFINLGDNNNTYATIGKNTTNGKYDLIVDGIKSFIMDHPNKLDKKIVYACIEGPEAGAYERATGQLINGRAFVKFSDHFSLVVNPETITINLTPISLESKGLTILDKKADGFTVGELFNGKGNYQFDWEAKGVRKGYEDYRVIREKSEYQVNVNDIKQKQDEK